MKKQIGVFLLLGILIIAVAGLTTAAMERIEPIKQGDTMIVIQTCSDCTYNNITHIRRPDGTLAYFGVSMEKNGTFYNYTIDGNFTNLIGDYIINGDGDEGGTLNTWDYIIPVTPSGFIDTLGFYIVLLIVLGGVVYLGFGIEEVWFVVLGGMGFIMLGIYSINYGVVGFRDMFMTWGIGLFEIAIGTILSVGAAIQKMDFD